MAISVVVPFLPNSSAILGSPRRTKLILFKIFVINCK
jgi:hypothetical protein